MVVQEDIPVQVYFAFGLSATNHRKFWLSTAVPPLHPQQQPTEVCVAAVGFPVFEEILQGMLSPSTSGGQVLNLSPLCWGCQHTASL